MSAAATQIEPGAIDAIDRRIVAATQAGLPLARRPYAEVARRVGVSEAEVIEVRIEVARAPPLKHVVGHAASAAASATAVPSRGR